MFIIHNISPSFSDSATFSHPEQTFNSVHINTLTLFTSTIVIKSEKKQPEEQKTLNFFKNL